MNRTLQRIVIAAVAGLMLTSSAWGYSYFVYFAGRTAPFTPIPEKFDLSLLPNKTVRYFISDQGPTAYPPGDDFTGLVSQIQLAAKAWNDVASSDLRLAFGGFEAPGTPQSAAGIDVVFDPDLPPGLLGQTFTTPAQNIAPGAAFVPLTRSTVHLPSNLQNFPAAYGPMPSYGEELFLVITHELGHALGLQHTFTSGVMSTESTRGTTKAAPLSPDDVAGISALYPTGSFLANSGTITGQVTTGGNPVNMASVVAISPNGPAISALTNPDGTFTISGIPAGLGYYIYAHPIPPAGLSQAWPGGVIPESDMNGNYFAPAGPFVTQFYPGVQDPTQATSLYLNPGDVKTVNFNVRAKSSYGISTVTMYSYYGNNPVHPTVGAAVSSNGSPQSQGVVATGSGLVNGNSVTPGLNINVLGSAGAAVVPGSTKFYTSPYLLFYLQPTFGFSPGARHLVFSANNDIYVLPAGFMLVDNPPPSVTSVTPTFDSNGNRAALVAGSNFDATTRILFNGAQAAILQRNSDGSLLVTPPPGPNSYQANIEAMNGDGQISLYLNPTPPTFIYDGSSAPSLTITPSALTAGSEAMVEIDGFNVNFAATDTTVGFGSSDIAIRKLWTLPPDGTHPYSRILANVSVNAAAPGTTTEVTTATGLQLVNAQSAFQILPAVAKQIVITPPVTNTVTGLTGAWPGSTAVANVSNLNVPASSLIVTLSPVSDPGLVSNATVLSVANGRMTFQIPTGLPVGPAVLNLQIQDGQTAPPILMTIAPLPPQISAVYSSANVVADTTHPAHPNSVLALAITGLGVASTPPDPSTVHVNVGGVDHIAYSTAAQNGAVLVQINLSASVPTGDQVPVIVTYNNEPSQPVYIPVH